MLILNSLRPHPPSFPSLMLRRAEIAAHKTNSVVTWMCLLVGKYKRQQEYIANVQSQRKFPRERPRKAAKESEDPEGVLPIILTITI